MKERLEEFLGGIFNSFDSSLTWNIDCNNERIEVSFQGLYDEIPQYYSLAYKFESNKIHYETVEGHWNDIDAWSAKTDLLMYLFLTVCWNFDYSKS